VCRLSATQPRLNGEERNHKRHELTCQPNAYLGHESPVGITAGMCDVIFPGMCGRRSKAARRELKRFVLGVGVAP
jgi:hypothetical protein